MKMMTINNSYMCKQFNSVVKFNYTADNYKFTSVCMN